MFQNLLKNLAGAAIRHVLTGLGGSLVADGYISASDDDKAIGAILFLIGAAWSGWQKYQAHRAAMTGPSVPVQPVEVHNLPAPPGAKAE